MGWIPRWSPCTRKPFPTRFANLEATCCPVITDGEQRKYHNFWTYRVHGLKNTSPDGFKIPFSAGPHPAHAAADCGTLPRRVRRLSRRFGPCPRHRAGV